MKTCFYKGTKFPPQNHCDVGLLPASLNLLTLLLICIFANGLSSALPSTASTDSVLGMTLARFNSCRTFISLSISPPSPRPRRTTSSPSASSGLSAFSVSPPGRKLLLLLEKTSVSDLRPVKGDGFSDTLFLETFSWATFPKISLIVRPDGRRCPGYRAC